MLLYFEAEVWMFITVHTTLKSKSEKWRSPKTTVVSIKIFSNNNLIYVGK